MHGFELADLIRVNQLVRGRIDFEGFRTWYTALPPDQRRGLTYLLCEFAHQAGVIPSQKSNARGSGRSDPCHMERKNP